MQDYRFPAHVRDRVASGLAKTSDIHDAADIVFWSNPAAYELHDIGVRVFGQLPPAFAHLLALSSLHSTVLDSGFTTYLRTRRDELPWAVRALRAAGMPELAAAAIIAARDASPSRADDILDRFWEHEEQVLANPDQIKRPKGARVDDPDEIYDINEPADFEERVLDYVRANLDDFVETD
ncbi:DMP19 family protein [Nocardia camponoti]|uniref:DNA mimic protein DMP19 C-terminal domain-containing protein n=1 Tax=Nocardia camponoti TaxID=1616106 RepID=A0A917QVS9_9NOCA|nr:hypothetical protein [Nocardia camponoti]GGK70030.1 hypothetical protein GCM10011591_47690 [Nocardia camponoti]